MVTTKKDLDAAPIVDGDTPVDEVDDSPKRAKVVTNGARERLLFEGLTEDAEDYVKANFPRIHVEPGSGTEPLADVTVAHDDGTRSTWDGLNWTDSGKE